MNHHAHITARQLTANLLDRVCCAHLTCARQAPIIKIKYENLPRIPKPQ